MKRQNTNMKTSAWWTDCCSPVIPTYSNCQTVSFRKEVKCSQIHEQTQHCYFCDWSLNEPITVLNFTQPLRVIQYNVGVHGQIYWETQKSRIFSGYHRYTNKCASIVFLCLKMDTLIRAKQTANRVFSQIHRFFYLTGFGSILEKIVAEHRVCVIQYSFGITVTIWT